MTDTAINFAGKVHGANLTTKPGDYSEAGFWSTWDWSGWIRPQIDYAMSLGANVIRAIGDIGVVNSGTISQGTYNTRLQQLVKYCVDNGLAYYYTGCATYKTDGSDNGLLALSDATISAIINSNIGAITGVSGAPDYRANIIGCDLVQEANAGMTATRCGNVYNAVQPNVPATIGCTFSFAGTLSSTSWINSILSYCDYLDYHVYPQLYGGITNIPTPTDVTNGPLTSYSTKEVFFGEGGANQSQGTSGQITSWLAGLQTLGNMANSKVRGAMWWSPQDQSNSDSNQKYGAFDSSWTPRSEIILPWIQGLAAGAGPSAPKNLRVLNSALVWDPTGCSNAWASTKLYRNASQIANPIYCRYDDSANMPAKQWRYRASAITTTPSESAAVEFIWPGRLPRRALRRRAAATFR